MSEQQQISYHTLTSTSGNPAILTQLLAFLNTIFAGIPGTPEHDSNINTTSTPDQLATWQANFSIPGTIVLYATMSDSDRPVAVLFALARKHPELPYSTLHISFAGVDPALRGKGVWKNLVDRLIARAHEQGVYSDAAMGGRSDEGSERVLTICTYPKTFERMFALLVKSGWEIVGWREEGKKVLMKLAV